jgi:nickel transport protein
MTPRLIQRLRLACWFAPLAGVALLNTTAVEVRAHAIESTLEHLAGASATLALQSRFSNGEPAAGADVALVSPFGTSLSLGRTDAQGQLRFALPPSVDSRWELRVDQGPGHRDYLELPVARQVGSAMSDARATRAAAGALLQPRPLDGVPLVLGAVAGVWVLRRRASGG